MPRVPHGKSVPVVSVHSPAVTTLVVAAAIIERGGRLLITRRPQGVHLEGHWEFPGGKCEPAEPLLACLAREIREELAVDVRPGQEVFVTSHTYPDRVVELHFVRCELMGDPAPQLGQEMAWVERSALAALAFPPADALLIERLIRGDV